MRKYLKNFLFLVLTIILLGIVFFILKKEHKVSYSLKKDDYNFQIEENFHNKTLYDFFITTNKKNFAFTLNKNYFKQRKIIKNIDVYHKKDLLCIYPIFKNDYKEDYHCLYKNKPVSISYLSTLNDDYIQKFLKTRALKLKISVRTVQAHMSKVMLKLNAQNRVNAAIVYYMHNPKWRIGERYVIK